MTPDGSLTFRWRRINPALRERAAKLKNPPSRAALRYATDVLKPEEPVHKLIALYRDESRDLKSQFILIFTDPRIVAFNGGSPKGASVPYADLDSILVEPLGDGQSALV